MPDFGKPQGGGSHTEVGSLAVGSFHTAPMKAPISPLDLLGVVWELYGRLTTCKLPSCSGLIYSGCKDPRKYIPVIFSFLYS